MTVQLQSVLASVVASAVTGATVAGFVNLQDITPGTPQTGHINVTGTVRAGNLGLGAAPGANRAQVTATGATGGLRVDADTGVGVSVFTNGLAGQFITRGTTPPNNRAVVGDAQASTGVTYGGVFATRTTGTGAGAFARAIGANNTATGLIAENTAATGKALVARNTGNSNSLEAGTASDSLVTNGAIPRHRYYAGFDSAMVPIAYGYYDWENDIIDGSGNFAVTRVSPGRYDIDVAGVVASFYEVVVVAMAFKDDGNRMATGAAANSGDFRIQVFDLGQNSLADSAFTFIAYRRIGRLEPPAGLARPDMGSAKDLNDWQRRDPTAYRRWRRAYQAWEREALTSGPASPTDTP